MKTSAQNALDFGLGASISVGYQNEWAGNLRLGYEHKAWLFLAEYSLFFRRDVAAQNTKTFNEALFSINYRVLEFKSLVLFGGLGYVGTNFPINANDPDATNLFIKTGNFKNGGVLKFMGILPLGHKTALFSEVNFKTFGRRYDTFTFGFLYRLQGK